jgi:serine protease AprX
VASPVRGNGQDAFTGIAPDARIVSVKVADAAGATDVSQVIAGLDWVVQHGRDGDLDVRVVNLSFGTDGVQDYSLDPMAYAVERVWRAGIVVVVSGGNEGYGSAKLNDPAYDPYVLAVGGSDSGGTTQADDDVVAPWSSRGDAARHPDLVAPGTSVVSLRSPGSSLDLDHPAARIGSRFFRGSGTSQATATVSGVAALLLQQRPGLAPDQVKALLEASARDLGDSPLDQGAGAVDASALDALATPALAAVRQAFRPAVLDPRRLVRQGAARRNAANDAEWEGRTWSGRTWSGRTWSGRTWSGRTWSLVGLGSAAAP